MAQVHFQIEPSLSSHTNSHQNPQSISEVHIKAVAVIKDVNTKAKIFNKWYFIKTKKQKAEFDNYITGKFSEFLKLASFDATTELNFADMDNSDYLSTGNLVDEQSKDTSFHAQDLYSIEFCNSDDKDSNERYKFFDKRYGIVKK